MIRSLLLGCLLLGAASSFAVSRVGGGVLWNPDVGFQSALPESLNRYYIGGDDSVRGEGAPVLDSRSSRLEPQVVYVFILANEQPIWSGVEDRQVFIDYFLRRGWTAYAHPDSCVVAFRKETASSVTYALNWGKGQGILVNTNLVPINQASGKKIVDTLVRTGPCLWK